MKRTKLPWQEYYNNLSKETSTICFWVIVIIGVLALVIVGGRIKMDKVAKIKEKAVYSALEKKNVRGEIAKSLKFLLEKDDMLRENRIIENLTILNEGNPATNSHGFFLHLYLNKRENLKRALAGEPMSEAVWTLSWSVFLIWLGIGVYMSYMTFFPIIFMLKLGWRRIASKWPLMFHIKLFFSSLLSPFLLVIFIARGVIIGGVLLVYKIYKLIEALFAPIEM